MEDAFAKVGGNVEWRFDMPTSNWRSISPIIDLIMDIEPRPHRILDIGLGYGKYGLLCREYLTYWDDHQSSGAQTELVIDGIEAFPEYIGPIQSAIYDKIYIGDAIQLIREFENNQYDLVLMMDVLEHMDKETGLEFIQQSSRVGSVFIVSTPKEFAPQPGKWGNKYEEHKSVWTVHDLKQAGACLVLHTSNHIAIFAQQAYAWQFRPLYWHLRNWYYALPLRWQTRLSVEQGIVSPVYKLVRRRT